MAINYINCRFDKEGDYLSNNENVIIQNLTKQDFFSRHDVHEAILESGKDVSESLANYMVQQMLKKGLIIRVGRNKYSAVKTELSEYNYVYSQTSKEVARIILENHPFLDFRLFELIQLNEFVNHLISHNVVFIAVEGDLGEFVFSTLKQEFPGKVLLNPTSDIYHNYVTDDTIVIYKLISESPRGTDKKWNTKLEKVLVDLITDKCIKEAVSEGEISNIFTGAFEKYAINEDTLFRYALRRGSEDKVRIYINRLNIKLRTEKK